MTKPETQDKEKNMIELNDNQAKVVKSVFSTGYNINPSEMQDGQALRVESLDNDIKNLTYSNLDFTIYPDLLGLGAVEATSTVQQYVAFAEHGRIGHSLFQPEVGIPDTNMPKIRRKSVTMKNIVDTRSMSFLSQAVGAIENPESVQENDSITVIGKTIEWAIFNGDSSLSKDENEGLEFDGLPKLIDPRNKLDLRGRTLSPEVLNKAAVLIGLGFGVATDAYMPIGVLADFSNQFLGAQRIVMPTPDGTTAGTNVDVFNSAHGKIRLHGSTVMDMEDVLNESADLNPQAPSQVNVAAEVVADKGGQWLEDVVNKDGVKTQTGEVNVEQSYKVVAVGAHGESIPSEVVKATPAKVTDGVQLTISFQAVQSERPDYLAIYRKGATTGNYYLIARVPSRDMNDQGQVVFTDTDLKIPETTEVFVGQLSLDVIALYQLLPLMKFDLATVTTASNFGMLWSGALALYVPRRWAQISGVRYNIFAPDYENHLIGANLYGTR